MRRIDKVGGVLVLRVGTHHPPAIVGQAPIQRSMDFYCGLLGFEFLANQRLSYFVELGGMGTGAKADKTPLKPIYSNGFTASTGIRFRL